MQRFVLVILACFWAFMGFRLWQVEYGGKGLGVAVPIAIVWDKVLKAQDEAPLSIVNKHTGEQLGWLNWAPSVTRDETVKRGEVGGMVDTVLAYSLDVERGRLFGRQPTDDLRFNFHISFGPEREWTDVQVMLQQQKPYNFDLNLNALATNNFLTLSVKTPGGSNGIRVLYSDLNQPQKLVSPGLELAGFHPWVASGMSALAEQVLKKENLNQPLDFKLPKIEQAHYDLLPGVRTDIKVFRVDVPVGNGLLIKLYISMLGEVLRVEIPKVLTDALSKTIKLGLPRGIVLRNENYYGKTRPRKR